MNIFDIRLKLTEILESGELNYDDFVAIRIYEKPYSIILENSDRYRGSKSLTASFLILDGYDKEPFHSVYLKTNNLWKVMAKYNTYLLKKLMAGDKFNFDFTAFVGEKSMVVGVYRDVHILVSSMADDMCLPISYVASLMIMSAAGHDDVIKAFAKYQYNRYNSIVSGVTMTVDSKTRSEIAERVGLGGARRDVVLWLPKSMADRISGIKQSMNLRNNAEVLDYLASIVEPNISKHTFEEERKNVRVRGASVATIDKLKRRARNLRVSLSDYIALLLENIFI